MPESNNAGTAAATAATGEPETGDGKGAATAPATPATGEATTSTATGTDEPTLTPDEIRELIASNKRMQDALSKANEEAQKRRQEAKEAERAKLSAEEAAAEELRELREAAEQAKVDRAEHAIEREVTRLTPTLGLIDPEAIAKLLDWDKLSFDGEGTPTNVKEQVEELIRSKPWLAGKPAVAAPTKTGANAGAGTSASDKPTLTAAELEAAEKAGMSPAQYEQLKTLQRGSSGITLKDWKSTRAPGAGGSN